MLLEICASSLTSAINAQAGGAQRIELCCNLEQGGLTPSAATIQLAREKLDIDIFVLIRPRIGDFNYSKTEFEQMKANILFCKAIGIDGVVFGILDDNQMIDVAKNKVLVDLAKPMQTTFHRAFDCLIKPLDNLEKVIDLGFDRILTSGLAATAIEGQHLLKALIQQAAGNIIILPGSGLNSQNINDFIRTTGAKEVHASAKKVIQPKVDSLFSVSYFETDRMEVERLAVLLQQFS
ncbi:MAG: copper homeostasis protein CutC [Saprospiraceae bacterium]